MKKRFLCLLLALVMVAGMIPSIAVTTNAANESTDLDRQEEVIADTLDADPPVYASWDTDGKGHYLNPEARYAYYWIDRVDFSSELTSGSNWCMPGVGSNADGVSVWMDTPVLFMGGTMGYLGSFSSFDLQNTHTIFEPVYQNGVFINGGANSTHQVRLYDVFDTDGFYRPGDQTDIYSKYNGVFLRAYYVYISNVSDNQIGFPGNTPEADALMHVTMDGVKMQNSDVNFVPNTYHIVKKGPNSPSMAYPSAFHDTIMAFSDRLYLGDAKAEIHSVNVNGTSVADGATYTSFDKQLTVKITYDSELYSKLKGHGCTLKEYGRWYLNGNKLNVAAVTPVDNGDGTSSETYYRTLNTGDELEIETWLEVKWPDGSVDIVDRHTANIAINSPKFTTQPTGGTVGYNESHIVNWATNFNPVKQELVRYSSAGNVVQTQSLSAGAFQAGLSYMMDGYYYRIRAYYDNSAYIESDKIYVTPDQYFTPNNQHGNTEEDIIKGITYVPNGDGTFNANIHVDLSYVDGQMLQHEWIGTGYYWYDHNNKLHFGSIGMGTSEYVFTLNNVGKNLEPGKEWRVKIYLSDDYYGDYEWRDYSFHYVTDTVPELKPEDLGFTTQPVGGEVAPGEKLTVNWETNFTPVKQVLLKFIVHPVDGLQVQRTNLSASARSTTVSAAAEYYIIRSYYSDTGYVDSNKFTVTEVEVAPNNGLVVVDGVWGYYEGGVLQTDFTGLVPYGDLIFYVENGILDFTYTGLAWYNDAWTYVANSQLTQGYTGLVWFNDNWFYVVDSIIDWTFTGLVPYEGNYFYVQNNLLDWSYTGLGYHDGGWYFIQNGLLQKEYSGLVYFNDNWFYVEEGVLTYQYFGMVEYEGNLFYVQASHLDWSYTGLGYHEGAWYYFQNALYTPSFTGLVPFDGSLFYVKNGTVDWSYNGTAVYEGVTYTVKDGVAQ